MKKKLIIVLTFLFALFLIGCKDKPSGNGGDSFSWKGKEAVSIKYLRDLTPEEIDIDEFELSMLHVEVEFGDGTKQQFDCGEGHFSLSKEIKTVGTPRLTIICDDEEGNEVETANFTVRFVSYTAQDEAAIKDAANAIVAKRNGDKVDFVLVKTDGLASGQLRFTYDASKLTLSEITKGSGVGYVDVEVKDGKVSIGFASDANLQEGTVICSIAFSGDYRNSSLALDETFENACWAVVDNAPVAISDVVYHVSRK